MSLPPLPGPQGVPDTIYRWLGLLKSSFDKLSAQANDTKAQLNALPEGITLSRLNERLTELEGNTGILQRIRVEHDDYPNDTFQNGSATNPSTLATHTFTAKKIGTTLWVGGQVVHSTDSSGPDANGCTLQLYVNSTLVDSRTSYLGELSYDNAGVFLFWETDTTEAVTIEIKALSTTGSGTRFRSPGTYFIFEELQT